MNQSSLDPMIEIKEIVEDLFSCINNKNDDHLRELFHPKAIFANIGNANELYTRTVNEFINTTIVAMKEHNIEVENKIEEIKHLQIIDGVIAALEINYTMVMKESISTHTCFLHLVKESGKWYIFDWVDRGIEIQEGK